MALTQVKTSGIADDAVTLAKQAAGTDGQVITYDASGNPVAVGPGTDGQVLTSTGAGSPPAFETLPASNNYSHPNHSGDVTSSGDGATTIANNAVTAPKTDLSIVQGDIIYGTGTDTWDRLAKGTAAQVLAMNSGATAPEWAAAGGGELKQIKWEHQADCHTGNDTWTDTGFEIDWTQTDANNYTWAKLEGAYINKMGYGNPPPRLYVRMLRDGTERRSWQLSHTNQSSDNTLNEDGGNGYDWHRYESLCLLYNFSDDTSQHTWKVQFKEVATTHYGLINLTHCIFSLQEYGPHGN